MKIAVQGCSHGELDTIYKAIQHLEKQEGIKIDLLICCGDFQATRNAQDLACMAVSQKYRKMCTFYQYYSGEKEAPIMTLFIGGNHEASNYLQELGYGGWAAPNIYYIGYAGVVNFGGLRIGGLSGIYKSRDYMRGHFEIVPYTEDSKRSVYHIRNLEVFRLKQITKPIDIMISHDWPRGVTDYGDKDNLLKKKPFFKQDIDDNVLGSKPAEELLHDLQPSYWFAAHLHCKFSAVIQHGPRKGDTKFLALDKCLPRRPHLQVIDVERDESKPLTLCYDLEWLTILHLTNHLLSVKKGLTYMPGRSDQERWIFTPTEEEKKHVLERFGGDLKVPLNFRRTVSAYNPDSSSNDWARPVAQLNPQTTGFCERLGVDDPVALLMEGCSLGNTPCFLPDFLTPDRSEVSFTSDASPVGCSRNDSGSTDSPFARPLKMSLPPPKLTLPDDSSEIDLTQEMNTSQSSKENDTSCKSSSPLVKPLTSHPVTCSKSLEELSSFSTQDTNISLSSQESQDTSTAESSVIGTSLSESINDSQTESSEPSVPLKKFKRRNQAIYMNSEDE